MLIARPLFLALTAAALLACSPPFDWREHRDGDIAVLFPAKTVTASKPVTAPHLPAPVPMTVVASQVGEAQFALAKLTVTPALQAQTAQFLVNDFAGKFAVRTAPKLLNPAQYKGFELGYEQRFTAQYQGKPYVAASRSVVRTGVVYQLIVAGPIQELPPEQIDTFLDSLSTK